MLQELNTIQLNNILKTDKCSKHIFIGIFARDQLPKNPPYPSCFIINTDVSDRPGAHWLAFYYNSNKECHFFDSYGLHPSIYGLTSYLNRTSRYWIFNKIKYQSFLTKSCGYFAFVFLLLKCRGIDLSTIELKEIDLNFFI